VDNTEVLRGVITQTDVGTVGANLLSKEQFNAFYELAETQHPWMNLQNTERRTAFQGGVPRIDFTGDVIEPATEAIDTGNFFEPAHSHVAYVQTKGRTAFALSNETVQQTADPDYENRLVRGFTRAWGRSFQKIAWLGDTTSPTPILSINDGWAVQVAASGNVVNGSLVNAGDVSLDHFYDAKFALPAAWKQRQNELRWAVSPTKLDQISEYLSARGTPLGDQFVTEGGITRILGIQAVEVPTIGDQQFFLISPQNTTVVINPKTFALKRVDQGLQVVGADMVAYVGFFHADFILLEAEATVVVNQLNA